MIRKALAILAALAAAMATFVVVEQLGHRLYPAAAQVNWQDVEAAKAYMDAMPLWAYTWIWSGWVVGSLLAGFIAFKIAKSSQTALPLIVGGILTASAALNFYLLPHPLWFVVLGLITFLPAVWLSWNAAPRLGQSSVAQ
jgi:hypothetical protein